MRRPVAGARAEAPAIADLPGAQRRDPMRTDEAGVPHENQRAAAKAPYAQEAQAAGARPSRKSTRGGANRLKPDHSLNTRESIAAGSPERRHEVGAERTTAAEVRGRRG